MTTLFHLYTCARERELVFPCVGGGIAWSRGHRAENPQNRVETSGHAEPPLPPLSCRCKHPHPHKDIDGLTRCTRCGRRCLPQLTLTDEAA